MEGLRILYLPTMLSSLVIKLKNLCFFLLKHRYSLDSLVQCLAHGRLLVMSEATLRIVQG